MKVLLVNKFHWVKGGSETYYFDLGKLLKDHGHEVAYFSMKDEKNITTGDKEYFVEASDMNSKNVTKALDVIYSKNNYKKMIEAIEDFKPDVVHVNNFQRQLSASVIKACNDKKVPVVYTAHDLQSICPAILMMDSNKQVCEACMHGKYMNCFKKKCIKDSTLKSLLGTIENNYYRNHKVYIKGISHIITPSYFFKEKLVEDGIPENQVTGLHNFIDINIQPEKNDSEDYILYFGRLSREKGILTLIDAYKQINTNVKLYIAGTGPEEDTIKQIIKENNLEDRINLLGFVNHDNIYDYIYNSKFIVVPSIWYENCPYTVLETIYLGKSTIGSDLGGIPELVEDNKNGYIYNHDNVNELKEKIESLLNDENKLNEFNKYSKEVASLKYSKENYYNELMNIYAKVVEENK